MPFSVWPGGSFGLFTDSYLKLLVVFVLMMNTLTTPKRLDQITWLIVLCCGFIAARSVFDYARGINLVEGDRLARTGGRHLRQPERSGDEHGHVPAGGGGVRAVAPVSDAAACIAAGLRDDDARDRSCSRNRAAASWGSPP